VTSDVGEFGDAVRAAGWERAVALQGGPFLDAFYLPGSGDFARWVDAERQRLARERARALEALAVAAERDPVKATAWWRLLAAEDPYSSRVALKLMGSLAQQGDRAAAVQHAQTHAQLVEDDLGLQPDPEVVRFAEELKTAPAPVDAAPPRSLVQPPRTTAPAPPAALTQESRGAPIRRWDRPSVWLAAVAVLLAVALTMVQSGGDANAPGSASALPTSVAVLPFVDISPSGDQEYFADGLTEELIGSLSSAPGLHVVSRTSAFAFKDQLVDVRQVGGRLGVATVVEGSVRKSDDRVRVSVRLVDASTGFELWSDTFERRLADVFAIQDEIAQAVVGRLSEQGGEALSLNALAPIDAEAFNLYLRGRYEWHKRSEAGLRSAVDLFGQAIEEAPEFARAHVGLGDAYAVLGFYDYLSPSDAFPRAIVAARRAIELDPSLAEPHATLGYAALYYDWDGARSEEEFRLTIHLSPEYSTGHQWYANLLTAQGRFAEAITEMRRAQELDPLSLIANAALGFVYYHAGQYGAARDQLEHTLVLDPHFELAHLWLGMTLEAMDRPSESLPHLETAVALSDGGAIQRAALARALALADDEPRARALLAELLEGSEGGYAPAFEIAKIFQSLGEEKRALEWLERAFSERSHSMVFLAVDPQFEELRIHPIFARLVEDVGIAVH